MTKPSLNAFIAQASSLTEANADPADCVQALAPLMLDLIDQEKALAIGRNGKRPLRIGARLKENLRRANHHGRAGPDIHRHQLTISGEIENLLAVVTPHRIATALVRYLHLSGVRRKCL